MPVQTEETEDYKSKYKNLKRKLKMLIYENECFQEELAKGNRALLRVRQDNSFLLDQLAAYHPPQPSSSDSELTDNSDTETSAAAPPSMKRKRTSEGPSVGSVTSPSSAFTHLPQSTSQGMSKPNTSGGKVVSKQSVSSSKQSVSNTSTSSSGPASKPGYSGGSKPPLAVAPSVGKKRGGGAVAVSRAGKQGNKAASRQRRAPHKLQKGQLSQTAPDTRGFSSSASTSGNSSLNPGSGLPSDPHLRSGGAAGASGGLERELSREEVERHLLSRQTLADFNTPVSLTLPHQLFSDNIMDGDLLGEEIETSPSNMDEDITVDNYD